MEYPDLVVPLEVNELPDVCVQCGGTTDGKPITKVFYWHHPGWYLTILLGVLVYVLIALGVRRKHRLTLSMCREHRRTRLVRMLAGYVGFPLLLVGFCFASITLGQGVEGDDAANAVPVVMLICALLGVTGFVIAMRADQVLRPSRMDREEARYRGASPTLVDAGVSSVANVFE